MTPVSYAVPGEFTSPKFAQAFAHGCRGTVCREDALQPGAVAMFGSPKRWALLQKAITAGREWWYGDHAYFGRGIYYRITRNAYQCDGTSPASPERFMRFDRAVQPWRTTGSHVLVCPQSDTYFSLFGIDSAAWASGITNTLRRVTDREVRFRWKRDAVPIAEDLRDAWAVVVFSSNAAVDALIAGIPVFVLAPFAATARMGLSDLTQIGSPFYPDDREPFLWSLAENQWTMTEMETGVAWRALNAREMAA